MSAKIRRGWNQQKHYVEGASCSPFCFRDYREVRKENEQRLSRSCAQTRSKSMIDGFLQKLINIYIMLLKLWLSCSTRAERYNTHTYQMHDPRTCILVKQPQIKSLIRSAFSSSPSANAMSHDRASLQRIHSSQSGRPQYDRAHPRSPSPPHHNPSTTHSKTPTRPHQYPALNQHPHPHPPCRSWPPPLSSSSQRSTSTSST